MASALSNPAAEASRGRDLAAGAVGSHKAAAAAAGGGLHLPAHSALPAKWNNNSVSRHGPPGGGKGPTAKAKAKAANSPPISKSRGGATRKGAVKNVNKVQEQQQHLVLATGLSAATSASASPCDSNNKDSTGTTSAATTRRAPPSPPGVSCSFRVCEDLLCSSDELRVFTEEGEEEERESGGARLLQEELEAALFEEKSSLIRETELGLKQEGFFSRLEAGQWANRSLKMLYT